MLHALRNLLIILPLLFHLQMAPPPAGVVPEWDEAKLDFPNSITFRMHVNDRAGIEKVTLIYGTDAQMCLDGETRHDIEDLEPSQDVYANWTWDLNRSGNLPVGVKVHWQWEIVESSGAAQRTEVKTLQITDPNFTWKVVGNGKLNIQYAQGNVSFGQMLLDTAISSLSRITQRIGVKPPDQINIVVYPSAEDLRSATLHMPDWIGGVAFPEYSAVYMAIGPTETQWAADVIPHELTHMIVDRRISNCQGADLPTWLGEGLAVASEGPASDQDTSLVTDALKKDRAQPLVKLADGFSADSYQAEVEYAQSGLVTRWLLATYGAEKMDALLGAVQEGNKIDAALQKVYSMDTDGVDQAWRVSLGFKARPTSAATPQATLARTAIPTLALQSPLTGKRTETPTPAPTLAPTLTSAPTAQVAQAQPTPIPSADPPPDRRELLLPLLFLCAAGAAFIVLVALGAVLILRRRSPTQNRL